MEEDKVDLYCQRTGRFIWARKSGSRFAWVELQSCQRKGKTRASGNRCGLLCFLERQMFVESGGSSLSTFTILRMTFQLWFRLWNSALVSAALPLKTRTWNSLERLSTQNGSVLTIMLIRIKAIHSAFHEPQGGFHSKDRSKSLNWLQRLTVKVEAVFTIFPCVPKILVLNFCGMKNRRGTKKN